MDKRPGGAMMKSDTSLDAGCVLATMIVIVEPDSTFMDQMGQRWSIYEDAMNDKTTWTQEEAITLCRQIEAVCPEAGCHIALTGGTLYKEGERKDLDLLFYRIRQEPAISMDLLWERLETIGIKKVKGWGWCYKAEYKGRSLDCLFPEEAGQQYGS